MVTNTTSWTLAAAPCPIPVVDARPAGFQGTSVPMAAAAAYGHIGLGSIADSGVARDKGATGGTAWGPPV